MVEKTSHTAPRTNPEIICILRTPIGSEAEDFNIFPKGFFCRHDFEGFPCIFGRFSQFISKQAGSFFRCDEWNGRHMAEPFAKNQT
jgi:hypothetical protein